MTTAPTLSSPTVTTVVLDVRGWANLVAFGARVQMVPAILPAPRRYPAPAPV